MTTEDKTAFVKNVLYLQLANSAGHYAEGKTNVKAVRNEIYAIMKTIAAPAKAGGYLSDFKVVCDESNNQAEHAAKGEIVSSFCWSIEPDQWTTTTFVLQGKKSRSRKKSSVKKIRRKSHD